MSRKTETFCVLNNTIFCGWQMSTATNFNENVVFWSIPVCFASSSFINDIARTV